MEHPSAHKGSYVRKRGGPGKRPGRRRSREQITKDARALDLYCDGKTYQQVADEIGWKSGATALMAVRRAIADQYISELDQVDNFYLAVQRIQRDIAEQEKIIATPHYVVSTTGKLVTGPDGLPMLDDGPKARALEAKARLYDQLNKLQGNYAPARKTVEVIEQSVVDAQIQAELEEIRKLADAGQSPGPGVIREP